jgi:hypothetical protein
MMTVPVRPANIVALHVVDDVHLALDAVLRQLGLEQLVDGRILLLVGDLIAALGHAGIHVSAAAVLWLLAALADGEEQDRVLARVEVLVEPHLRRDEHDAGAPVHPLDRLAGEPEEGEARTGEQQHVDAGAVAVPLLVDPDGPRIAMADGE